MLPQVEQEARPDDEREYPEAYFYVQGITLHGDEVRILTEPQEELEEHVAYD